MEEFPSLIVFDCDYTLWQFDCDKDHIAPFKNTILGIIDSYGYPVYLYRDVLQILRLIADANIPIAFASRNNSAVAIESLLRSIQVQEKKTAWDMMPNSKYFHAYSRGKNTSGKDLHFTRIKEASSLAYSDMLFFDDKQCNIDAANAMGITSILVKGLTMDDFTRGIDTWKRRKRKS